MIQRTQFSEFERKVIAHAMRQYVFHGPADDDYLRSAMHPLIAKVSRWAGIEPARGSGAPEEALPQEELPIAKQAARKIKEPF